ncbi:predicted protein [Uncinocarpus reesii 1704]|uniref:Mitochondrial import inner membrane translocase subunit TIM50 n=1 Tax=Uncinocarpus reesii (strain UAMH 1704) TaxID=336963 RepID=C4JP10_UNCRE|nr:uncharacterized protein UREG_03069 [Uncinocarpus reesii 1704]EEP78224.1 predicted protein [Uncinocarpus reesii 1704]
MPRRNPRRARGRQPEQSKQDDTDARVLVTGDTWRPGRASTAQYENGYYAQHESFAWRDRDSWRPGMNASTPPGNQGSTAGGFGPYSQPAPYWQTGMPLHNQRQEQRFQASGQRQHTYYPPAYAPGPFPSISPAWTGSPSPLLIILDMNGTLIHRKRRSAISFVRRPGLDGFLNHIFDRYTVMIWTSSKATTVREVLKRLVPSNMQSRFATIWARDKLDLTKEQYNEKVQVYKRLDKIWNDTFLRSRYPKSKAGGPAENHGWDHTNTILIDDSRIKAAGQPYNIIEIPEFTNDASVDEERNMKIVMRQLRILSRQQDASRKIRQWNEMMKTADPALSTTEFWEAELSRDEERLGLEPDVTSGVRKRRRSKKGARRLEADVEQEIEETQSALDARVHITEDSQLEDQCSDVTDDEPEISVPKDIIEQDPAISTTPSVPR